MKSREQKIMIVEDEGLIAADLQRRLEGAGYSVAPIADSAEEAMRIIRETSPDLVLMDIRIKGEMDGIAVAQRVRNEFDVPIIYLTAYEDQGTLERACQSQAFGYIKKPIASASLTGSIEIAISKHRQERYLRRQEEWFRTNFTAIPEAVLITDATGRVCYVNGATEKLTGRNAAETLGQPCRDVLHFYHRRTGQPVDDYLLGSNLLDRPIPLPGDLCLRDRHGRSFDIEGSVAPKCVDGHVEGTVFVFRDRTVTRFQEERSKQHEKQEALVRMSEDILHGLEAAINVVTDESSRLLDSLPFDSPLRDGAERIERAALDSVAVTGRLEAFAQVPRIHLQQVCLSELLEQVEIAWKQLLPGFKLRVDFPSVSVQADPWQLTRAIVSVLIHATRFADARGEVMLAILDPESDGINNCARVRIAYRTAK